MKDWVRVYFTDQIHRAEIVKAVLEENEIQSVLIDKRDSNYLFGDIELFVSEKDAALAGVIIQQHEL